MAPLHIERTAPPRWLDQANSDADFDAFYTEFGGQVEWSYAIPSVLRALVAPSSHQTFPIAPGPGDHSAGMGYYNPLVYLLIYSLGWTRPDRGLLWWYQAGRPTDDPRLRLMQHLWGADGSLDLFAHWTTKVIRFQIDLLFDLNGLQPDDRPVPENPKWRSAHEKNLAGGRLCPPEGLHLEMHCREPLEAPPGRPTLDIGTSTDLRATLTCDSMIGWYNALVHAGPKLPDPEQPWTIDVVRTTTRRMAGQLPTVNPHRPVVFRTAPLPRARDLILHRARVDIAADPSW